MINTITFVALALLFAARAPVAIRQAHARPAWIASGVGILGLLSIGVVIPIPVADMWLGGSNLVFLLRTVLPVIAFWFLRDAVALQAGKPRPRGRYFLLTSLLAAQALLFFLIPDRAATNILFVDEHMIYPTAFLWACVYIGAVIWIAAGITTMLLPLRKNLFAAFTIGGMMTIAGGFALATHCALILFRIVEPVSGDVAWVLFNLLFYPGILLIVVGFVAVAVRDGWAMIPWRLRALHLRRAVNSYGDGEPVSTASEAIRAAIVVDPVHETYEAAIALRNLQYLDGVSLQAAHIDRLIASEHELEQIAAFPTQVANK